MDKNTKDEVKVVSSLLAICVVVILGMTWLVQ